MKRQFNITIATLIICASFVAGCAELQKSVTNAQAWWQSPATQAGIQIGLKAAGAALIAAGEDAAIQQLTGGSVGWTEVGKSAGSAAIRQIELTPNASNTAVAAAKVADAVLAASHNPAQATAAKTAVISGLTAAQASGADSSGALEGIARALEAQGPK